MLNNFITNLLKCLNLDRINKADMNVWWTGYAASIPGFSGSWLTIWYLSAAIWAGTSLILQRFPFVILQHARPFAAACWAYTAIMIFSSFLNNGIESIGAAFSNVLTLALAPLLIARFTHFDPERSLNALYSYAPLGATLGLSMGLAQFYDFYGLGAVVVKGGAGNASVYGVVMAWVGLLSLAHGQHGNWFNKLASIIGFLISMIAIVLSEARSLYPCILLLPLLYLWTNVLRVNRRTVVGLLSLVIMLLISGYVLKSQLKDSVTSASADIELLQQGSFNSSIGIRIALWSAAVGAIREKPLLGHGETDKMAAVMRHLPKKLDHLRYSHVHNALLDSTVSGGILGAVAFIAIFLTPLFFMNGKDKSTASNQSRYVILAVLAVCGLNASTNTMFTHDLLSVLFLLPMIIVAALPVDK